MMQRKSPDILRLARRGCGLLALTAVIGSGIYAPGEAATTREIAVGHPVIAVTNEQSDGTIWVLAGLDDRKTISKVDVATGQVERRESVSSQAVSIAQSSIGGLVLGTANGTSSAVVLYGGDTGNYIGTIPMRAPVVNVSISGGYFDAIEAFRNHRTLWAFNIARKGFQYVLPSDAVASVPVIGATAVWVVRSSGSVYKLGLSPAHVEGRLLASTGVAISISPNGFVLYVLEDASKSKSASVEEFSPHGASPTRIKVPPGSVDIALSVDGSMLFDAVSTKHSGRIEMIPLAS
jgi:hypothetical protein